MKELSLYERFGYESDEEEADRLAEHFRSSPAVSRIVARQTIDAIKEQLDDTPRWRLIRRWRLVRAAESIAEEAQLVG